MNIVAFLAYEIGKGLHNRRVRRLARLNERIIAIACEEDKLYDSLPSNIAATIGSSDEQTPLQNYFRDLWKYREILENRRQTLLTKTQNSRYAN